jgi:hypothetical protein
MNIGWPAPQPGSAKAILLDLNGRYDFENKCGELVLQNDLSATRRR